MHLIVPCCERLIDCGSPKRLMELWGGGVKKKKAKVVRKEAEENRTVHFFLLDVSRLHPTSLLCFNQNLARVGWRSQRSKKRQVG